MSPNLLAAAAILRRASRIVAMTGAGVSAESGIRTFRDTMEGLWKEFDPQKLATPQAFAADPATVTRWYDWRRLGCLAADPNPGHLALVDLQHRLAAARGTFTLLTQNVDRLHHKAGSTDVIELHGSIIEWRCTRTARKLTPPPQPFAEFPPRSPFDDRALLRPDVVWFGEALPDHAISASERAVDACDLFLSIGTSSLVFPAAGFAQAALQRGAAVIEINPHTTPLSRLATCSLRGTSGEILPELLRHAFPS